MIKNGIVGVGDICNTEYTLKQKVKKNLKYYNFIELYAVKTNQVEQCFNNAKRLKSLLNIIYNQQLCRIQLTVFTRD